jgi:hypothetical protein
VLCRCADSTGSLAQCWLEDEANKAPQAAANMAQHTTHLGSCAPQHAPALFCAAQQCMAHADAIGRKPKLQCTTCCAPLLKDSIFAVQALLLASRCLLPLQLACPHSTVNHTLSASTAGRSQWAVQAAGVHNPLKCSVRSRHSSAHSSGQLTAGALCTAQRQRILVTFKQSQSAQCKSSHSARI